ncbi:uncharacterized protein LOC128258329 isoform X2 [Drosophila gunungcola]|uniref:uncharacterized protein LOC128258329 isoform X2 n=1 Tax=Drosophila gunungcola TaxID=103775 RepID=UPI0022DED780|nr:uncharacterized protein LOC128258329 isoform X2 [Drosophila gunungcola]
MRRQRRIFVEKTSILKHSSKMSRLLLQCRSTLLVLRHQTAVENEKGLFSKLVDKYTTFRKEEKHVPQEEEPKRS